MEVGLVLHFCFFLSSPGGAMEVVWVREGPPTSPQAWGDFNGVAWAWVCGWGGVGRLNPLRAGDFKAVAGVRRVVMVVAPILGGACADDETVAVPTRAGR